MKSKSIILLFLLFILSGCNSVVQNGESDLKKPDSSVITDEVNSNLMMLYDAAASNRNAIEHEVSSSTLSCNFRIVNQSRNRISNQNQFQIKLIAAHLPDSNKLSRHPITFLIAFSKEYHIFQLRRIRI